VNGDGIPDLFVSNRDSNNIFQLDGTGRGFFNDQAPVIFNTGPGSAPVQTLVGNFDGNGPGLLAVDSGSNDLTLFSRFGPGHSFSSGGEGPVAALAGDFNHDGFTDLIVANNGDGHITLLRGTADGPLLIRTFSDKD